MSGPKLNSRCSRGGIPATDRCARAVSRGFRPGIALLQVMCVVAVAVVLSYALLSSSALQVKSNSNRADAMQADALADSGMNLALYYIENPLAAPTRNADGYWPGENSISFGEGVRGAADVAVARTAANTYSVTSTGKVGNANDSQLTHTAKAVVKLNKGLTINKAVSFAGSTRVGANFEIYGNVACRGTFDLPIGSAVNGVISAVDISLIKGLIGGRTRVSASSIVLPSAYTINTYKTYTYAGKTYKAAVLSDKILRNRTLGPTGDNPAGVYVFSPETPSNSVSLTLAGNVTINGTLVVENAVLNVIDKNNVITAAPGFPALIASKEVAILGKDSAGLIPGLLNAIGDLLGGLLGGLLGTSNIESALTVNGLAWLGESIHTESDAPNADVRVVGALVFGGSGGVPTSLTGRVRATYDATRAAVPDIDTRFPSGPQIVTWGR